MAYLNEFPHVEANKLNLDWLLEQYSTFDQRLQEVQNHFDEVAEAMERSNEEYQQALTNAFNAFKQEVERESYTVERTLETLTNNMTEYVGEHITEWQIASSRASCVIDDYIGSYTFTGIDSREHDLVIDSVFYARTEGDSLQRTLLNPEYFDVVVENNTYRINITSPVRSATMWIQYHLI